MRITFRKPIFASFFLSLAFLMPFQAHAWGNAGHEAVACVAWQKLTPATKARVLELLKLVPTLVDPKDASKTIPGYADWVADMPAGLSQEQQNMYLFMRAATWPDSIKHQWLHDSDNAPAGITTDVNIGFTDTASHGYWHFVDAAFASDKSAVPATPTPDAATQIVAFRTAVASDEADLLKAYDLIWLEHIVGDIHQPLHGSTRYNGGTSDEGGNNVLIKLPLAMKKQFEGTLSKSAPTELHAFWDDLPGEGQPATALGEAETFANSLAAAPAAQAANTDPDAWAAESLAMAKKDAYSAPIGATAGSTKYTITTAYYNKAMKDAKARVALAGARLADLLNNNLK